MSERKPPSPLEDLKRRLTKAGAKRPGAAAQRERGSGLSFALRIGVDLVAALIVGVGIGLLLDNWLGTKPWMLIVFFILGAAAGMLNVFRAVSGQGYAAGYRHKGSGHEGNGHTAKGREGNGPEGDRTDDADGAADGRDERGGNDGKDR